MGEQIKVADLAKKMIVLSGLVPDQDIRIVYSGLRPGEKLFEELFEETEQVEPTSHPKIQRAIKKALPLSDEIEKSLMRLEIALGERDEEVVIRRLQDVVPSFQPFSSQKVQPAAR